MKNDEQFTQEMLQAAGRRPPVPAGDMTSIKEAARATWRQKYASERPARRPALLLPLAAAILGGLVLMWWRLLPPASIPAPVSAARVEALDGTVLARPPGERAASALAQGQALPVGSLLSTHSDSRAALRLTEGQSLRLDFSTRARLISARLVALERGSVYLDSQQRGAVTIRTAFADFQPSGTKFEVSVGDGSGAQLRVREGSVRLSRPSTTVTIVAGQEILVRQDGSMVRGEVRPDDPSWDWVVEAAPLPEIEGRSLGVFLDWFAREKGLKLQFADDETAALSRTIVLHGSVAEMSPLDALETVTLSSGFEARIENGALYVKTKN